MGDAGAVRRLLRRQGQGLLQGRGSRCHHQARRSRHRAAAGDRRRRSRRHHRLDALRARRARKGRAAGQHRPALQALRHDAHLPQGFRHRHAGRLQGQDARRLVLRQRVPVHGLDGQARLQDRRLAGRRQGRQAGLQRRSLDSKAGGVRLHDDLQRVLAGHRCRLEARGPRRLQLHRPGRLHAWKTASTCSRASCRTRPS